MTREERFKLERATSCPGCNEACRTYLNDTTAYTHVAYHHLPRKVLAVRQASGSLLPSKFNEDQKVLMIYFAFLRLADACEANSEKLFGKHISSKDIQIMFVRKGLETMYEESLIEFNPTIRKVQ